MAEREALIVGTGQMAVMCGRLLGDNGFAVTLLGRPAAVAGIRETRQSPQLPGVTLPGDWALCDDPPAAADRVRTADDPLVVFAVPTQTLCEVAKCLADGDPRRACLVASSSVVCCKGIECHTRRRPTQVLEAYCRGAKALAVLSGPNVAVEVIGRRPTGTVVACDDDAHATRVRDAFTTDYFRVYTTTDTIGVELAGATKNVIAIAAGIVDGLRLGTNAKASLVTRGLVEMTRLGTCLGARGETFAGLAGMGDLMTTCFSPEGRNRRLGECVGRGMSLDAALAEVGATCEGVPTTRALLALACDHNVEMPIASGVADVLFGGVEPRRALVELMSREPKAEIGQHPEPRVDARVVRGVTPPVPVPSAG